MSNSSYKSKGSNFWLGVAYLGLVWPDNIELVRKVKKRKSVIRYNRLSVDIALTLVRV